MWDRYANARKIAQMNPETDYEEIVQIVGKYESPWLIRKALEFALFRTYAVPHTSRILRAAGQFQGHGQKRYDDTTLMLAGIAEYGIDSDYGRAVISIMNKLHGRWNIKNEDMLYVLSTFVYEPRRWSERFGWRKPTHKENLANFYFWREVGIRMGIADIPEDYAAYERFNITHEREKFRYDEANHAIGEATMQVMLSWYPAPLRPLIREFLYALMDDPLLNAMGFPKPHSFIRWLATTALKLRAAFIRLTPPRRTPFYLTKQPNRTYGEGWSVHELGATYDDHKAAGD